MEEFKHAQQGLDALFDKLKYDRRGNTAENRAQRRQREKKERRAKKQQAKVSVPA